MPTESLLPQQHQPGLVWYMPHHPVVARKNLERFAMIQMLHQDKRVRHWTKISKTAQIYLWFLSHLKFRIRMYQIAARADNERMFIKFAGHVFDQRPLHLSGTLPCHRTEPEHSSRFWHLLLSQSIQFCNTKSKHQICCSPTWCQETHWRGRIHG